MHYGRAIDKEEPISPVSSDIAYNSAPRFVLATVNLIPSSTTLELRTNQDLTGTVGQTMIKLLETSFDNVYRSIFFGKNDTPNLELLDQLLKMGHACHSGRKK